MGLWMTDPTFQGRLSVSDFTGLVLKLSTRSYYATSALPKFGRYPLQKSCLLFGARSGRLDNLSFSVVNSQVSLGETDTLSPQNIVQKGNTKLVMEWVSAGYK